MDGSERAASSDMGRGRGRLGSDISHFPSGSASSIREVYGRARVASDCVKVPDSPCYTPREVEGTYSWQPLIPLHFNTTRKCSHFNLFRRRQAQQKGQCSTSTGLSAIEEKEEKVNAFGHLQDRPKILWKVRVQGCLGRISEEQSSST